MRFPRPGTAAIKSSPEAVFKLTLVAPVELADELDDELLLSVDETEVGVAEAQADSTIIQSNTSVINADFRFIIFSNF